MLIDSDCRTKHYWDFGLTEILTDGTEPRNVSTILFHGTTEIEIKVYLSTNSTFLKGINHQITPSTRIE